MQSRNNAQKIRNIIIQGYCRNKPVNYFLDSGATTSLVATRIVHNVGEAKNIEPTRTVVTGLAGRPVPMRGEITLEIDIGGKINSHRFIVSDNLDSDFLIGLDIMSEFEMCINIPKRCIEMPNAEIPFLSKPLSLQQRYKIKLQKTVTIPANTACFISGKFPAPDPNKDYEGIVEPYHNLPVNSQIFITGTLSYSTRDIIPVQALNVTDEDITLFKNQLIGFIEPLPLGDESIESVLKSESCAQFYDASIDVPRLNEAPSVEETIKKGKWKDPTKLIESLGIDELQHVPRQYREELKALLTEYSHCFARDRFDLGCATFFEAELLLHRSAIPKWIPERACGYKEKPYLDNEVQGLLKSDQISHAEYSLWNSPLFAVKKGKDSYRYVVDARNLNKNLITDGYSLPKIKNIFDRLGETKIMSSLDFQSSFTQVPLKKECRHLTAFMHDGVRYMFNRLIMGTTSASAIFSRMMAILFQKVPFRNLLLYIDDLCICSADYPTHLKRLRFVLDRLTFGNLKLNCTKTKLLRKEIKFVGVILSEKGVSIDPQKVKAITNLPRPNGVRVLQKFIGMVNYHRSWIPNMAVTLGPLYELLKKGKKYEWSKECEQAFSEIKKQLVSSETLLLPNIEKPFRITTDASVKGLAGVLSQYCSKTGMHRPVSYFSKVVPKHMRRWGATRLEFMSLHSSLLHWSVYLRGGHVECLTDCKSLLNLDTIFSKDNAFMQRRLADLSQFSLTVKHISGTSREIQVADYLSRYSFGNPEKSVGTQTDSPVEHKVSKLVENDSEKDQNCKVNHSDNDLSSIEDGESSIVTVSDDDNDKILSPTNLSPTMDDQLDDEIEPEIILKIKRVMQANELDKAAPVTLSDIRENIQNDKILEEVVSWCKARKRPEKLDPRHAHKELMHYWRNFELLKYSNGVLKIKHVNVNDTRNYEYLIVVPYPIIERVIFMCHDAISSCHNGIENTYHRSRRNWYWYKQKREIKLYVSGCVTCQRIKPTRRKLKAALKPITCDHFNQCIQIDHLEVSKTKSHGYCAILNIVDKYSSYLVSVPVRSTSAEHTAKALIDHWFTKHGFCRKIMHDQGSGFESALFKEIMKVFKIKNTRSTPWKSSTQGAVERTNQKMNVAFRAILEDKNFNDWPKYVNWIALAINSTKTVRTGFTPNFLCYGREVESLRELYIVDEDNDPKMESNVQVQAYQLFKNIRRTNRMVREITKKQAKYMCNQWNAQTLGPFFKKGDYCMILVNVLKHKYSYKWSGPYKVLEKLTDHNYIVLVQGVRKVISITKMKKFTRTKYSKMPFRAQSSNHDDGKESNKSKNTSVNPTANKPTQKPVEEAEKQTVIIFNKPNRRLLERGPHFLPSITEDLELQNIAENRQGIDTPLPRQPLSPVDTSTPRDSNIDLTDHGGLENNPTTNVIDNPSGENRDGITGSISDQTVLHRSSEDSGSDQESTFFTPQQPGHEIPVKREVSTPPPRSRPMSMGALPHTPSIPPKMVRDRNTGRPIPQARERPIQLQKLKLPRTPEPRSPRSLPEQPISSSPLAIGPDRDRSDPVNEAGPSQTAEVDRSDRRSGLRSKSSLKKTQFFGSPVSSLKRRFSKGKGDRK